MESTNPNSELFQSTTADHAPEQFVAQENILNQYQDWEKEVQSLKSRLEEKPELQPLLEEVDEYFTVLQKDSVSYTRLEQEELEAQDQIAAIAAQVPRAQSTVIPHFTSAEEEEIAKHHTKAQAATERQASIESIRREYTSRLNQAFERNRGNIPENMVADTTRYLELSTRLALTKGEREVLQTLVSSERVEALRDLDQVDSALNRIAAERRSGQALDATQSTNLRESENALKKARENLIGKDQDLNRYAVLVRRLRSQAGEQFI